MGLPPAEEAAVNGGGMLLCSGDLIHSTQQRGLAAPTALPTHQRALMPHGRLPSCGRPGQHRGLFNSQSPVPGRRWLLAPALVRGGVATAGPGPCVAEDRTAAGPEPAQQGCEAQGRDGTAPRRRVLVQRGGCPGKALS